MKKRFLSSFCFLCFCMTLSTAQTRYLQEIFPSVLKTSAVYGNNHSVLTLPNFGHTKALPQRVDVYTPQGDNETKRPLILYLPSGNFLPLSQNSLCSGSKNDSCCVEVATRLAKMGYVVAVVEYRLGWRPDLTDSLKARFSLLNAIYRGVQDVHSCIRFFRKSVALQGNPYGIDPDRIAVWGQGSGGTLALSAAYLNAYEELLNTPEPNKFQFPSPDVPSGFLPMVIPYYNGDLNGLPPGQLTVCNVDEFYAALSGYPLGDTLCTPQNPGYASNFNLCINSGGALPDSSWLNAGEMPLISFHVKSDFYTPCYGNAFPLPIVPILEMFGACTLHETIRRNGNDAVFTSPLLCFDPYMGNEYPGFRPFSGTPMNSAAPWEWRGGPNPNPPSPLASCNNDAASSRAYIDTMIAYFAPRACKAFGLNCCPDRVQNLSNEDIGLQLSANPAHLGLDITASVSIRSIVLFDLNGRIVRNENQVNNTFFSLPRQSLASGLYIVEIGFESGTVCRKVIFD